MPTERRRVDASVERAIATALVTDRGFLAGIEEVWRPELAPAWVSTLAEWCLEHFRRYGNAPGRAVEVMHEGWAGSGRCSREDEELMSRFLTGLSRDHEAADQKSNTEFLLDQAERWMKGLAYKRLNEALDQGSVEDRDKALAEFRLPERKRHAGVNPLTDHEGIRSAFERVREPLFELPGSAGELVGAFSRGDFASYMGPEKRGKCTVGTERVLLSNGDFLPIQEVIATDRHDVVSFDESSKRFVGARISKFWKNGMKQAYLVRTKSGRVVRVTGNHPFLSVDGWRELNELYPGDFVAVPREIPFFGNESMPSHKVRLLAYLIADGGLTGAIPVFTKTDPEIQRDFTDCVESSGCGVSWNGIAAFVVNGKDHERKHGKNFVRSFLKEQGLFGKLSTEKIIPSAVFRLPRKKVSEFLQALFSCDGWCCEEEIGYGTASEVLSSQVHHLLSRFGIVSTRRFAPNEKSGSWSIEIGDYENMSKFMNEIGFFGCKKSKAENILRNKKAIRRSFLDRVPYQIAARILSELKDELGGTAREEWGRFSTASRFHSLFTKAAAVSYQIKKKKPIMRQSFSEVWETKTISKYLKSDILWDEIKEIIPIGKMETFDLTVDEHHNFTAENILVHNSWSLTFAGMRALESGCRVLIVLAGDLTLEDWYMRNACYITGRHWLQKFCGKILIPITDCQHNQTGECERRRPPPGQKPVLKMTEEKDKSGAKRKVAGERVRFDQSPRHEVCTECMGRPQPENKLWFRGAVWWRERGPVEQLEWPDAVEAVQDYHRKACRGEDRLRLIVHPNESVNVRGIEKHMDRLVREEEFVPDVVVVDYADVLAPIDSRIDFRHQQNQTWSGLRRITQERHCALLTATQADARSYEARDLRARNFTEDKRKYGHVNKGILTLNQEDREKDDGVMRLGVMFAREDHFSQRRKAAMLQCYAIGRAYVGGWTI